MERFSCELDSSEIIVQRSALDECALVGHYQRIHMRR
jgi:hypothetical protein